MNSAEILKALPTDSPWYPLAKMAPPNVNWCETNLSGYITEPANTWSNIFYIILAYILYRQTKNIEDKNLKKIVPAIFIVGISSGIYHASFNFFTQLFDFVGMFLMTNFFVGLNLIRYKKLSYKGFNKFYLISNIVFTALAVIFYLTKFPLQTLILVQAFFLIFSEVKLKATSTEANYKPFALAVGFIVVAITFSLLDVTRTMCSPDNHYFQGHATWHLFSAVALYFAFTFYKQFNYKTNEV
jgi:hypothetical protein